MVKKIRKRISQTFLSSIFTSPWKYFYPQGFVKKNGFKLFSSQILFLKGPNSVNSCHYFDDVSLSNFRSCCLPWKWRQCLRPPLRNQTLIPRHPLEPFWSKAPQTKLIDQSQVQSVERSRRINRSAHL
jgi:hypothetical protein